MKSIDPHIIKIEVNDRNGNDKNLILLNAYRLTAGYDRKKAIKRICNLMNEEKIYVIGEWNANINEIK